MKRARLVLSDAAAVDILEQAEWYREQSGPALAKRWEKAVGSAMLRVVKNPIAGSPCTFRPAELRGVRRAPIRGFSKHLLFYKIDQNEIFLLRVLHGARDLESLL